LVTWHNNTMALYNAGAVYIVAPAVVRSAVTVLKILSPNAMVLSLDS
jgi:hypothetical protein